MSDGIDNVKTNIKAIFERRRANVYALCLEYAAEALEIFRKLQPPIPNSFGEFWHNQTAQAAAGVISDAFIIGDVIGWFLAHTVEYGPYLELANDRRNEAIRPIVQLLAQRFYREIKELYGEAA